MPIDRAGTCAPAPWTPKPTAGSVDLSVLELVCSRVVHQRSAALTVESPVDVAVTRVWARDPRNPSSAIPIWFAWVPVFVTMLSHRTHGLLLLTNTCRDTSRFTAEKLCVAKTSWRSWPFCVQFVETGACPGL